MPMRCQAVQHGIHRCCGLRLFLVGAGAAIAFANRQRTEHHMLIRLHPSLSQTRLTARQWTAIQCQNRPPALRQLHQCRHATAHSADARHLRSASAVQLNRQLVG
mgnify:FL=1